MFFFMDRIPRLESSCKKYSVALMSPLIVLKTLRNEILFKGTRYRHKY